MRGCIRRKKVAMLEISASLYVAPASTRLDVVISSFCSPTASHTSEMRVLAMVS